MAKKTGKKKAGKKTGKKRAKKVGKRVHKKTGKKAAKAIKKAMKGGGVKGKGTIPLPVLEKRLGQLNYLVKRRGGKALT
jgi:hypothetical protein